MSTAMSLPLCILLPSLIAASTICPNNTGMQDHQINKFLNAHNLRRQILARGEVVKRNGNKLPSAADMLKMNYNCTLEAAAITQARLCSSSSGSSGMSDVGENRAQISSSLANNKLQAIEKAVSNWWKQSRGSVNIGQKAYYRSNHVAAAQFARMAWSSTHQLGCGIAGCYGYYSVVCMYYPAGATTFDQTIYQPGTPCTACPTGTTCIDGALCT